ncbi:MAG: hypothetical protein R3A80_09975 [Bdellovibrionota bacterium]
MKFSKELKVDVPFGREFVGIFFIGFIFLLFKNPELFPGILLCWVVVAWPFAWLVFGTQKITLLEDRLEIQYWGAFPLYFRVFSVEPNKISKISVKHESHKKWHSFGFMMASQGKNNVGRIKILYRDEKKCSQSFLFWIIR